MRLQRSPLWLLPTSLAAALQEAVKNRSSQAAANVSIIRGALSEQRAAAMSSRGRPVDTGTPYSAAALSLVFHAASPLVPTLRADVRLFQVSALCRSRVTCIGAQVLRRLPLDGGRSPSRGCARPRQRAQLRHSVQPADVAVHQKQVSGSSLRGLPLRRRAGWRGTAAAAI